jgi:lipoprotein NlpI
MYKDSWNVMRRGEVATALRQMQENYAADPDTSHAMELGIGYLWLKDYEAAWEHFNAFNQKYPRDANCTYAMAGVAKWCLGKPEEAIKEWLTGDMCDYSDVGKFEIPLLFHFAGTVEPTVYDKSAAGELLAKRVRDAGITDWPVPLVEFILDEIDESELRGQCFDERFEDETLLHHWLTDFYLGIQKLDERNTVGFRDLMRKIGNFPWTEFDECERLVLSKLWSPEFFLARHEGFESPASLAKDS